MIDFNKIKGFISDMDGVIYHGNQILPGVREFVEWMQKNKKGYLFLTNNSGSTPMELHQKLENGTGCTAGALLYECACDSAVPEGAGAGLQCICHR